MLGKQGLNAFVVAVFDEKVKVDEVITQLSGQHSSERGFSRTHIADEKYWFHKDKDSILFFCFRQNEVENYAYDGGQPDSCQREIAE